MRKLAALFFTFILCLPLSAGDGAYEFAPGTYCIMDKDVDICSEPDILSEKLGRLQPGDRIELIEQAAGCIYNPVVIDGFPGYWYRIRYGEISGFVFSKSIAVKTYPLENIPGAFLFFRYSDSSHSFYTYDVDKDFVLYKDGEIKTFPIIRQTSDSSMALWNPSVHYSESFNPGITLICFSNSYLEYGPVLLFILDESGELHYLDSLQIGDKNHMSDSYYQLSLESDNNFTVTSMLGSAPFRVYHCTLLDTEGEDRLSVTFFNRESFISNYADFPVAADYSTEENLVIDEDDFRVYERDGIRLEYFRYFKEFVLTDLSVSNPEIDFGEGIKVGCSRSLIENLFCTPDYKTDRYYLYRTEYADAIFYFDEEKDSVSRIVFSLNV